ncbi:GPP34 family phosphoprotein [Roseococcus sp. SDR]|uniref:GOLPH3/VPS74 family protein n=1 Tax=Roseococcus sp. SDR TaxID=2835532 RepID=UPI001BCB5EA8|nr:GPP34 family phosphoprotein [Roseococcus sp. SDR]MBS7788440.1 GPP34 family phosphoprotein [Roseococcus sp. SDR]MBV1843754.1 GPP34 family phosphoprotein [Roseococcus sp. SDR]
MTVLSLPEEIVLLTFDDETGRSIGRQGIAASIALAGAVMMELALAGRVDTDRHRLEVLDDSPTGDPVLDAGLPLLRGAPDSRGALMLLAREETGLRPLVLSALMARGLLKQVEGRVLLVFPERRYLKPEDRPEPREVRARLLRSIETDDIPEPREALLLGLARATALLPLLVPSELLAARQERIQLLNRIEALNRSVAETVGDLYLYRLRSASP